MNQPSLPEYINDLQLPTTDLTKLSFCATRPAKVEEWANEFRATQTTETSILLYHSLPEAARLKCSYDTRLEILEALRPAAQNAVQGLTRSFLQQPINLPESAQKTAIIAQAIQKSMIDGYGRCVSDICAQKRFKPVVMEALAKALHRAITGIGLIFFRNYQLYTQLPTGFWHQLHVYFQIAEYFDLLATPVKDPLLLSRPATNIQTAYMRVLLMATARMNQLSRNDIAHIYNALESWSQYARLHPSVLQDKDNFYLINLSRDQGPIYKSRFNGSEMDRVLELDFRVLVNQLSKYAPSSDEDPDVPIGGSAAISVPSGFPPPLLDHLMQSWSSIAQRKQERRAVQSLAEVSVGMVDTHYLLCGEQPFDEFAAEDVFDEGFEHSVIDMLNTGIGSGDDSVTKRKASIVYQVHIQNVSAGGCCLLWKGEIPTKLRAGEIMSIKESGRHSWSLGVVRWVRQYRGQSQLGIQTLANHPRPYGIAQGFDMGGYSDYMRAFYLPASKNGRQPESLLTASAPFKELDKVKLFDGDSSVSAKLNKLVFATGAVQQFIFNTLDAPQTQPKRVAGSRTQEQFDDEWD
ncbi:conserved hypothetical protein [Teredinibacter turnerae T7901]|uniref:GTPase-translation elongation factor n=1 Tax=Teredinibacter turnerae (strain ATCC 39867 / T7901) TaxID=377629 RepID=C5BNT6_TERTT|nr:PilZ domain-containing protein [Teredinibacter turnerae]ACR12206.1 conserved hypothetical protein [Teredinibacter turnerae T7901]